jgi:membrane protease YdiL (CAAX protease family)
MAQQHPSLSTTSRQRLPPPTLAGLFVALILPFLLLLGFHHSSGTSTSIVRTEAGEAALWANFLLLIGIVLLAEKRSLSSIGLKPLQGLTLPLGLLAAFLISLVFPLAFLVMTKLGISHNVAAAERIYSLPFTLRLVMVLTAAVVEETLFRSYPIERLTAILGNKWLAGLITIIVFTVAHVPFWGAAQMIPVFLGSILLTLLYLWKRDLVVNIVAHFVVDGIGFLLVPLFVNRSG